MAFEQNIKMGSNKIFKECWKGKVGNALTNWGRKEKKNERCRYGLIEVYRKHEEVQLELVATEKDREVQIQEQQNRIEMTRYNPVYTIIQTVALTRCHSLKTLKKRTSIRK